MSIGIHANRLSNHVYTCMPIGIHANTCIATQPIPCPFGIHALMDPTAVNSSQDLSAMIPLTPYLPTYPRTGVNTYLRTCMLHLRVSP